MILILLVSPNTSPNACPFNKLPHPEPLSPPERREKLTRADLFISGEANWSVNEISSCQLLVNCNPLHCLVICTHFCDNAFEHMNASLGNSISLNGDMKANKHGAMLPTVPERFRAWWQTEVRSESQVYKEQGTNLIAAGVRFPFIA